MQVIDPLEIACRTSKPVRRFYDIKRLPEEMAIMKRITDEIEQKRNPKIYNTMNPPIISITLNSTGESSK